MINKTKKTNDMVNIMRMICAYLVIMAHATAFKSFGQTVLFATNNWLCRITVQFFFVTSGYFFYSKITEEGYLKKYLKKLLAIFFIVSIVFIFPEIKYEVEKFHNISTYLDIFKLFFVNGIVSPLWYITSLALSLCVLYIFLKKGLIKPLLLLCFICIILGLMGDSYFGVIKSTPLVKIVNKYEFIFSSTRNGLCISLPFVTIGAMINKYKLNDKIKKYKSLLLISIFLYALEGYLLISNSIGKSYNTYFTLTLLVPLIFIFCLNCKIKINSKISNYFREMSLWIYCFHELFILPLIRTPMNNLLIYFISIIGSTFTALIISWLVFYKKQN